MALIIIIPIMQLFLLGCAATNDVRNIPLAVLDRDRSSSARRLLDAYCAAADSFRITHAVDAAPSNN